MPSIRQRMPTANQGNTTPRTSPARSTAHSTASGNRGGITSPSAPSPGFAVVRAGQAVSACPGWHWSAGGADACIPAASATTSSHSAMNALASCARRPNRFWFSAWLGTGMFALRALERAVTQSHRRSDIVNAERGNRLCRFMSEGASGTRSAPSCYVLNLAPLGLSRSWVKCRLTRTAEAAGVRKNGHLTSARAREWGFA